MEPLQLRQRLDAAAAGRQLERRRILAVLQPVEAPSHAERELFHVDDAMVRADLRRRQRARVHKSGEHRGEDCAEDQQERYCASQQGNLPRELSSR